jgi:flagellar basal-body rod protein FlgF
MGSGIYIATAGAVAQSKALDVTASNVANASSTAYRGARVTFRQAMAAAQSPDTAMVSSATGGIDGSAGTMVSTSNPLDLAIEGDGYFSVDTDRGTRYTRNGAFTIAEDGRLVTQDGLAVRGSSGTAIQVPQGTSQITVSTDGAVLADGNEVGRIAIARFPVGGLAREGDALLAAKTAPIASNEEPVIRSGMLEASNVSVVRSVVDMVKVSRTYESLMRVIEGYSQVEGRAARDLGGPK